LHYIIGGGKQGRAMTSNPKIDEIVLTGSIRMYNKIVWGSMEKEQEKNKAANTPVIKIPVCAKLGSVNPWIVPPGKGWRTEALIDNHAQHLVFAKMMNNGHICTSPQVLINTKNWSKRKKFLIESVIGWLASSLVLHHSIRALLRVLIQGDDPQAFKDQQHPVLPQM
jgi:acyl-CoA reductase-like NAD-dependent aldehyde dehydrogenase